MKNNMNKNNDYNYNKNNDYNYNLQCYKLIILK